MQNLTTTDTGGKILTITDTFLMPEDFYCYKYMPKKSYQSAKGDHFIIQCQGTEGYPLRAWLNNEDPMQNRDILRPLYLQESEILANNNTSLWIFDNNFTILET